MSKLFTFQPGNTKKPEKQIMKFQRSLNRPNRMLVYNKDQSIWFEAEPDAEILQKMGDDMKAFFWATLDGEELHVHDKAADQIW